MGKFIDLTGQRFGRLTVVKKTSEKAGVKWLWLCICECGTEVKRTSDHLQDNSSCGCGRFTADILGKKFNSLTVINYDHEKKQYLCLCDCGRKTYSNAHQLTGCQRWSCGCKTGKFKNKNKYLRPILGMKSSAKKRNISWLLSEEDATNLITKSCFYCGNKGSNRRLIDGEEVFFNGIDRVNSKLGYTLENCVPCCFTCNTGKMTQDIDDFKSWIEKVYNHFVKGESKNEEI